MPKHSIQVQVFMLILLAGVFHLVNIGPVSSLSDFNVNCIELERESLLKFKAGLTDPSGRLSSWVGTDCCKWTGVVCNNRTGRVLKLKLRNPFPDGVDDDGTTYSLGGEISPSLLNLKYLKYLDLSSNNFQGIEIPKQFGAFEKLRYLNLSNAGFEGTIPPDIGNFTRLYYLDLSNFFSVSVENNLQWLSGLYSLKYLNLGSVDLTGSATHWLQTINMLPSLQELHLPQCGLSVLPPSLPYFNLSSLSVLDLSQNEFNSSIPHWLCKLSKLAYLDLSLNNLQGPIPDAFGSMTSLQVLDLSENSFVGSQIPMSLTNLCKLQILDLSISNLHGEITGLINGLSRCHDSVLETLDLGYNIALGGFLPDSIGYLKNLKFLDLRGNSFVGTIPRSIGKLSFLKEFYLTNNNMSGPVPSSLGQLSSLVTLDISENSWEGVVTESHFANLVSLKELSIAKFSLSPQLFLVINMSAEWLPPFRLQYIKLRSCKVGPRFPAWFRNQNQLKTLILRNAGIVDTIPEWLWKLDLELDELDLGYNHLSGRVPNTLKFSEQSTVYLNWNLFEGPIPLWSSNVSALYLSNNSFSGPIPFDIGQTLPLLTDIDLSSNSLTGSVPWSIGNMSSLTTLVLSNNQLSGEIPDFWDNIPFLYVLDLSSNNLTGRIPSRLGSQNSIRFLTLSNNSLSGGFPHSLKNSTSLYTLDLGENRFSGKLPAWIGDGMSSLWIMRLRSNLFDGTIPPSFCKLSPLHIMDVAHNNLTGSIPPCFGNLTGMTSHLNAERYEGELRVVAKGREFLYKSTLYLVNNIDLSNNNLSGNIPETLTDLYRLGTLNLSRNHLTGRIPKNIERLGLLETLDLSWNQLHGPIPPSMASLTSLAHLDLSHNNFSGRIPTGNQFGTFDPSIYAGNPELCGLPLLMNCSDENAPPDSSRGDGDKKDDDDFETLKLLITMGMGFALGFWGVCGTLIVKKSWRDAFFGFVDDMKDRLCALVCVNLHRWEKGTTSHNLHFLTPCKHTSIAYTKRGKRKREGASHKRKLNEKIRSKRHSASHTLNHSFVGYYSVM